MFKFKVHRKRENQLVSEEGEYYGVPRDGEVWEVINFYLDTDFHVIECFESYVLFDKVNKKEQETVCTKAYLSNGLVVYAVGKANEFALTYKKFKAEKLEGQQREQARMIAEEMKRIQDDEQEYIDSLKEDEKELPVNGIAQL